MEKPIKRSIAELKNPNFVDYLYKTYEPQRNSAGEYFFNGLDYITNEMSYMASETEKEFIEENGLAPIGFLELLRIQMAKTDGFGICINNRNLKKAMMNMVVDYGLDLQVLEQYYTQLVESQIIVIITDSKGNKYATTTQTLFNWEYKMWTRWSNRMYQDKKRGKTGKGAPDKNELFSDPDTNAPSLEEIPVQRIDDDFLSNIFPNFAPSAEDKAEEATQDDFWNY